MLLHSRQGSGEHRPVDVNALVEESLNLAYHGARAESKASISPWRGPLTRLLARSICSRRRSRGRSLTSFPTASTPPRSAKPRRTEATASQRSLPRPRTSVTESKSASATMAPEFAKMKEKFQSLFHNQTSGKATGLGLSISHDIIVKQHSGLIEVDSQPGEYTEVRIILPRVAAFVA